MIRHILGTCRLFGRLEFGSGRLIVSRELILQRLVGGRSLQLGFHSLGIVHCRDTRHKVRLQSLELGLLFIFLLCFFWVLGRLLCGQLFEVHVVGVLGAFGNLLFILKVQLILFIHQRYHVNAGAQAKHREFAALVGLGRRRCSVVRVFDRDGHVSVRIPLQVASLTIEAPRTLSRPSYGRDRDQRQHAAHSNKCFFHGCCSRRLQSSTTMNLQWSSPRRTTALRLYCHAAL